MEVVIKTPNKTFIFGSNKELNDFLAPIRKYKKCLFEIISNKEFSQENRLVFYSKDNLGDIYRAFSSKDFLYLRDKLHCLSIELDVSFNVLKEFL